MPSVSKRNFWNRWQKARRVRSFNKTEESETMYLLKRFPLVLIALAVIWFGIVIFFQLPI